MPGNRQLPSSSRTAHRQPQLQAPSTGFRYVGRVIFTLLVLLFAVALGYLLLSWPADIHFAVLPITDSDVLALPPIRYSREDANTLKELDIKPAVLDLQEIQTSHGIDTLANKLQAGLKKGDALIVYLNGNFISAATKDGPSTWLLCSDFAVRFARRGSSGREGLRVASGGSNSIARAC